MRYLVMAVAVVLSACTMGGLGGGLGDGLGGKAKTAAPNPITGGEVSVTSLSGPPGAAPSAAAKAPPPNPSRPAPVAAKAEAGDGKDAATPAAATVPEAPKPELPPPASPEEAACRSKGGQWATVGKGAQTCVETTRDAGKSCRKASQCEGLCLARSGTCAPIKPLFGCNDILQDDGSQVTLCID